MVTISFIATTTFIAIIIIIVIIITAITIIIIISLLITILIIFCIHGGCPHTMILSVKINQVPPLYMTLGDYNHKDSTCKLTQGLPQSGGPWIGNRLHLKRCEKTPIQFCHHHHHHHHHLITYNCYSQFL